MFCLSISVQCGVFYNRLDDKVEKHDLYFVLKVFNIKKGEFSLVCVTVAVKLRVFLLFVIKRAVDCGFNEILFFL